MDKSKRSRLEIIYDILKIIQNSPRPIKPTPLLRRSNVSSGRFKEYYSELLEKKFIIEINRKNNKLVSITNKGLKFIEKYRTIISFIEEFEL